MSMLRPPTSHTIMDPNLYSSLPKVCVPSLRGLSPPETQSRRRQAHTPAAQQEPDASPQRTPLPRESRPRPKVTAETSVAVVPQSDDGVVGFAGGRGGLEGPPPEASSLCGERQC